MDEMAIVVHGGAGGVPDDAERIARMRAGPRPPSRPVTMCWPPAAPRSTRWRPPWSCSRTTRSSTQARRRADRVRPRRARWVGDGRHVARGRRGRRRARRRNPVRAARAVLAEGRHVLLVGAPAIEFAATAGLGFESETWFVTERERLALVGSAEGARGTVGAVARDARAASAAATSTGGVSGQRLGRVGDSPLIGAGTWADDATVAVSCTGHGESIIGPRSHMRSTRCCATAASACRRPARWRSRASGAGARTAG